MPIGVAAAAAVAGAASTWSDFTEWKQQHGRTYATTAEAAVRFGVWKSNLQRLEAACRENAHARFEADWTADWTIEELAGLRGGPLNTTGAEEQPRFDDASVGDAGPIDWVELGAVNAPVSQGRCGTCAQFSATADIEAQWFLHGHGLVKLSEQEMIDCASYTGPYGMGWVADVHKGLTKNRTYPLANHSDPTIRGCRSPCNTSAADPARSVAHVSGATCLGKPVYDDENQMLAWLQHGPLSVSVGAPAPLPPPPPLPHPHPPPHPHPNAHQVDASFGGYKRGVISGAGCNHTRVDHAVLLVGYGVDTSTVRPEPEPQPQTPDRAPAPNPCLSLGPKPLP